MFMFLLFRRLRRLLCGPVFLPAGPFPLRGSVGTTGITDFPSFRSHPYIATVHPGSLRFRHICGSKAHLPLRFRSVQNGSCRSARPPAARKSALHTRPARRVHSTGPSVCPLYITEQQIRRTSIRPFPFSRSVSFPGFFSSTHHFPSCLFIRKSPAGNLSSLRPARQASGADSCMSSGPPRPHP